MLQQAFAFKRWADRRTLEAVGRIDREAHPEPSAFAREQLNHIVIVEELFASRLTDSLPPHEATNTRAVPELPVLAERLEASNAWYQTYLSASSESQEASISFTFADGRQGCMTPTEMLFHVLTHGSYHRGNIARALDQAGVPHPPDGFGIFLHQQEPERRGA